MILLKNKKKISKKLIVDSNKPGVIKFLRAQEINAERISTVYLIRRNISLLQFFKKSKNNKIPDIRNFMVIKARREE